MTASEEYGQRLRAREADAARCETRHVRLGYLRLLIAALAAVLAWGAFARHTLSPWWLAAPVLAFVAVAVYHSRVLRAQRCAERAAAFYRAGLARVEDRWAGTGQTGERFDEPHHVYASDLDLFGPGSLFELLSLARTRIGEETLAAWLLSPAAVDQITERHGAVAELRGNINLREDLAVLGEEGVGVRPDALIAWAEGPYVLKHAWVPPLALGLAVACAASAFVWWRWELVAPFAFIVLIELWLAYRLRKHLAVALHGAEHAFENLELLAEVMARMERARFTAPRLKALRTQLASGHVRGSHAIARLRRIVNRILARDNVILRLLDIPLMYSVQVAFAAERWRRRHGRNVRGWLTALGEIEALLSLAAYSYEHPDDPFPEFHDGRASFEAEQLGHPLIPRAKCVRNDVCICGETRLLLVSGSNMSGKSTLLRAVGINTVLAMAGAPVRAARLRLTPLHVGASIRINESLKEGSSRFYAEITRLRRLFDLVGNEPPLLFLLDELLQGTNSHDRRIGAEGIVRALVARGAIGLVSTHDLALTEITTAADSHIRNVHFQDELEDGRISFDYKLRDGVVAKSNGLELMRSVGLDV